MPPKLTLSKPRLELRRVPHLFATTRAGQALVLNWSQRQTSFLLVCMMLQEHVLGPLVIPRHPLALNASLGRVKSFLCKSPFLLFRNKGSCLFHELHCCPRERLKYRQRIGRSIGGNFGESTRQFQTTSSNISWLHPRSCNANITCGIGVICEAAIMKRRPKHHLRSIYQDGNESAVCG